MGYDVHVVRTGEWSESEKKPITKADVDRLVHNDPELKWSTTDYVDMRDPAKKKVVRYFLIAWKGDTCFWWYRSEITCKNPDDQQMAKLARIARALEAFLIGDDGEVYELKKALFGGEKVVMTRH